ncbi:MAG: hypothetical protein COB36_12470 [Alphaproteobacteria bacterium]|nr:MAG: hypothetical protein COB36_12470 [Alphaproteobacteria bacterium]
MRNPSFYFQFFRYGLAGIINVCVGIFIYAFAIFLTPAPFWLANFFAMIGGIISGFYLANAFVFTKSSLHTRTRAWRYILTIFAQFGLSTTLIALLVQQGVSEIISYILVLPIIILLSFSLQKTWVFKLHTSATKEG